MGATQPGVGGAPAAYGRGDAAVVTPDAVGLELPVATVGSRGIAWLLDALVLVLGLILLGLATALLGGGGFVPGWFGIAMLLVLVFAWQFGYPIVFEVNLRGRTPGKAAMGLRVVTVEGAPVGFRHAAIRAILAVFELLPTLGAPAIVSSLASERGQRLGDLAAGTMVVRERRVGGPPQAVSFVPPPGLETYTARLDTTAVGPATYATIRDTLRRAPSLPYATRVAITNQLATVVAGKVSPPPPAGVPSEPWLWCVAAAVQARRAPTGAGAAWSAGPRPDLSGGGRPRHEVTGPGTTPPPPTVPPSSAPATPPAVPGAHARPAGQGLSPPAGPAETEAPEGGFRPPA